MIIETKNNEPTAAATTEDSSLVRKEIEIASMS
jgi:hypothetical protein